jgi:hypothetical protein
MFYLCLGYYIKETHILSFDAGVVGQGLRECENAWASKTLHYVPMYVDLLFLAILGFL